MSSAGHPPVPFVVGVPRSGTTLLRLMLDAHPQMAIPPETYFVPNLIEAGERGASPEEVCNLVSRHRRWGDLGIEREALLDELRSRAPLGAGDGVRAVFGLYAARRGKGRWGDKTPAYLTSMEQIAGALPEARFIHILRDGRDVALSVLAMPAPDRPMRAPKTAVQVAKRWRKRIERAREEGPGLPGYLEVRYEDLVADPEPALKRVCELIELDLDPAMLSHHERADEGLGELDRDLPARGDLPEQPAEARLAPHVLVTRPPTQERIGVWRREMTEADRAAFESIAGDLLAELGYEP
jgi:LPS sulfotransferase NodH